MIGEGFPAVLAAAQRGDEGAFTVLWRDGNPALLRYLKVIAPESAEGAHAVLGRLLAHKLRPARRRPRTTRGPIVGSPP